jgi:DNA-binding transcriptional ArsR family regulator
MALGARMPRPGLDLVFAALAHPKRRAMVYELALTPATVGQLATAHQLTLPAMHKHVRALEQAGLVLRKKAGRTNFLALRRAGLRVAQTWLGQYRADWGNDEETLENYIARFN